MSETSSQRSPITVCTLWQEDYHKGVGVLVNSLVRSGYRGRVWAGYRGKLPDWAAAGHVDNEVCTVTLSEGIQVMLCRVDTTVAMGQYKSIWMRHVLSVFDQEAEGIFYFDADIIVLAKWSFFEHWVRSGIAVCEDQSYPINPSHPLARLWEQYAKALGFTTWRPLQCYANTGLLGLTRETEPFLSVWQTIIDAMQKEFGLAEVIKSGTRTELFHQTDQDAFAVASAVSSYPISWVGIDGMAFGRGEWLTIHALSKPWRRRVFRDWLVEGHRPDSALRVYWGLAHGPIPVETRGRIRRHRVYIPLAALLARFHRRV